MAQKTLRYTKILADNYFQHLLRDEPLEKSTSNIIQDSTQIIALVTIASQVLFIHLKN